jgi:hypothetical protein
MSSTKFCSSRSNAAAAARAAAGDAGSPRGRVRHTHHTRITYASHTHHAHATCAQLTFVVGMNHVNAEQGGRDSTITNQNQSHHAHSSGFKGLDKGARFSSARRRGGGKALTSVLVPAGPREGVGARAEHRGVAVASCPD